MRMKCEDRATDAARPARPRPADRRVAVFHRERESARHERRAHALEFALAARARRRPAHSVPRLIAPCGLARAPAPAASGAKLSSRISAWPGADIPERLCRSASLVRLKCNLDRDSSSRLISWHLRREIINVAERAFSELTVVFVARRLRLSGARLASRSRYVLGSCRPDAGGRRLRRRRSPAAGAVRPDHALVGDRLLERRHRLLHHAVRPRSGRRGDAGRRRACAATSRSRRRPRS